MPAAWISAGGALLGALGGGSSSGGTQTVDKSPWSVAAPWLTQNVQTGQNLQNQYQANPFNGLQRAAYGNLLGGNDYINAMTPGLLNQFSQPVGFDRSNPQAKPPAYQFPQMPAMGAQGGMQPMQGLLGQSMSQAQAPAPAPAAQANPMDDQMRALLARFSAPDFSTSAGG